MGKNSIILRSWIALLAALLVWGALASFAFFVIQMQLERAEYASELAALNLKQSEAAQLHALARETASDRAVLEGVVNGDVISAVNLIESVRVGNVQVHVNGAQVEKPASSKSGATPLFNTVLFSVRAQGPFSSVMHILKMLETLPIAATMLDVNMARSSINPVSKNSEAEWALDARMRFITTSTL